MPVQRSTRLDCWSKLHPSSFRQSGTGALEQSAHEYRMGLPDLSGRPAERLQQIPCCLGRGTFLRSSRDSVRRTPVLNEECGNEATSLPNTLVAAVDCRGSGRLC